MKTTKIIIENLKCHGCANTITKGLSGYDEISKVDVNIETSAVTITFSGNDECIAKFKHKLASMGYPESGNNNIFATAKSYVSCAIGRIGKNDYQS